MGGGVLARTEQLRHCRRVLRGAVPLRQQHAKVPDGLFRPAQPTDDGLRLARRQVHQACIVSVGVSVDTGWRVPTALRPGGCCRRLARLALHASSYLLELERPVAHCAGTARACERRHAARVRARVHRVYRVYREASCRVVCAVCP